MNFSESSDIHRNIGISSKFKEGCRATIFNTINKFEGDNRQIGLELELNQLTQNYFGFTSRYLFADVKDDFFPEFNRDEHRVELLLNYIHPNGLSAGVQHGFRSFNYKDQPGGDTINYTDLNFEYLFPGRYARLQFSVRNIFDNNFNWVTDQFTQDGVIPTRNLLGTIQVNF